jgi:predicted transcriptional regulator
MFPDLKEIRSRRRRLRVSQRWLAKKVGVSQSIIAKVERGKASPSYALVSRIFSSLEFVNTKHDRRAKDIASRPVRWLRIGDPVRKAVRLFQSTGFKQLPIRDSGAWVGCVYERNISRRLVEDKDAKMAMKGEIGMIMDEALPSVVEEAPIEAFGPLLQRRQAVLVTRRGQVTGIITNADLLKLARGSSRRSA